MGCNKMNEWTLKTINSQITNKKTTTKDQTQLLLCAGNHPPITLCEQLSSDVTRLEMQAIHDMMLNEMLGYI